MPWLAPGRCSNAGFAAKPVVARVHVPGVDVAQTPADGHSYIAQVKVGACIAALAGVCHSTVCARRFFT